MIFGRMVDRCPKCNSEVSIWSRTCFGYDPHNEYACHEYLCGWRGRNPMLAEQ